MTSRDFFVTPSDVLEIRAPKPSKLPASQEIHLWGKTLSMVMTRPYITDKFIQRKTRSVIFLNILHTLTSNAQFHPHYHNESSYPLMLTPNSNPISMQETPLPNLRTKIHEKLATSLLQQTHLSKLFIASVNPTVITKSQAATWPHNNTSRRALANHTLWSAFTHSGSASGPRSWSG